MSDDINFDESVFHQRERTVDNIKRVYAVVYSLSFAAVLKSIFDYAAPHHESVEWSVRWEGLGFRLVLLVIFLSTLAVFAFQADKFLDLRYALRPKAKAQGDKTSIKMLRWRLGQFVPDVIHLVLTLVPFAFMAYSFDNLVIWKYGPIPFFYSYLLLLVVATAMVLWTWIPSLRLPAQHCGERDTEVRRYGVLCAHWFLLNGTTMALLILSFFALCPDHNFCKDGLQGPALWFLVVFAAIAMARNVFDSMGVWPSLRMNYFEVQVTPYANFVGNQAVGYGAFLVFVIAIVLLIFRASDLFHILTSCQT